MSADPTWAYMHPHRDDTHAAVELRVTTLDEAFTQFDAHVRNLLGGTGLGVSILSLEAIPTTIDASRMDGPLTLVPDWRVIFRFTWGYK